MYKKKKVMNSKLVERIEKVDTKRLENFLAKQRISDLKKVLKENEEVFIDEEYKNKFIDYMKELAIKKGLKQVDITRKAVIPYSYGRHIWDGSTHPNNKDIIIRLCITAGFSLKETNRLLRYNRVAPLYPKYKRDFVMMVAINEGNKSVEDLDDLLIKNGLKPLATSGKD